MAAKSKKAAKKAKKAERPYEEAVQQENQEGKKMELLKDGVFTVDGKEKNTGDIVEGDQSIIDEMVAKGQARVV